jgi:hypothetical protein
MVYLVAPGARRGVDISYILKGVPIGNEFGGIVVSFPCADAAADDRDQANGQKELQRKQHSDRMIFRSAGLANSPRQFAPPCVRQVVVAHCYPIIIIARRRWHSRAPWAAL